MATPHLIVPGLYELALPIPLGSVNVFFLLTADGVTIIDTGYPDGGVGVVGGLQALQRVPADVRHIIVTHHHVDHSGNLAALQVRTKATVWMHPFDAELVAQGQALRPTAHSAPGWSRWLAFRLGAWLMPTTITPASVDRFVADGAVIPVAGGLEVLYIPGHSAGQIGLYWRTQQVLFAADAVMHCGKALQLPIVLEDEMAAADSLRKLDRYQFMTVCFGHGSAITDPASVAFHHVINRRG